MAEDDDKPAGTLGRIALKQVRVTREEMEARTGKNTSGNPMNALVPYLDLFSRLDDGELARLAEVERAVVADLRRQIDEIDRALARYVDLLPRLGDGELTRLTGASAKTVRFWRLCNARSTAEGSPRNDAVKRPDAEPARSHGTGAEATPGMPARMPVTRTPAPVAASASAREAVVETERTSPQERAATVPGFDDAIDDDEIKFALIDDDDEQAASQARTNEAHAAANEDEDDLAFELSDDDFF